MMKISRYLFIYAIIVFSLYSCGEKEMLQLSNTLEISSQGDVDMFCDQYTSYQKQVDIKSQIGMDYSCLEPIKRSSNFSVSGSGVNDALAYIEELVDQGLTIGNTTDESIELPRVKVLEDLFFLADTLSIKRFTAPKVEQIELLNLLALCKTIEEINGFNKVELAKGVFISAIGEPRSLVIDGFQKLEEVEVLSFNFENVEILLENGAFANLRRVSNYLYVNAGENGVMNISNLVEKLDFIQCLEIRGSIPSEQICEFKKFFDIEGFEIKTGNFGIISKEEMEIICP